MNDMSISVLNLKVLHEVAHLMGAPFPAWAQSLVAPDQDDTPVQEGSPDWVSSRLLDQLYRDLVAATGRTDFGLMAACSPVIVRYDVLPMLIMHAPNLGEALGNIIKYAVLVQERAELALATEGDTVRLKLDVMHASAQGLVCRSEFVALGITHILRLAGQGRAGLLSLHLAYPAPAHADQYKRHFDCPVVFSSAVSELVFERAMLSKTIFGADPLMYSAVVSRANQALSALKGQRGLEGQVGAILLQRLHERPRMDTVAEALGLGERTLRRRLGALGIDFQSMVTRLQMERACSLLAEGERSIQQIASDVGFASVSAFHRAFLRWTGATPKSWQERASQPPA
jgi:AraC-like DNA-binding protein